jgi:short-subunit dehydrogenase
MRISGSRILLTGASSGIGAALASELDARGARLALVSRRPPSIPNHLSLSADLMHPGAASQAAAEAIQRLGGLDMLIHCAGVGLYARSWETPPEDLRMFELNFFSAVELAAAALPHMIAQSAGRIVLVSSIAGLLPLPWFPLYSASKAAVDAWARALRSELHRTGVGVLHVAPGYVKTNFQANVLRGVPPPQLAHIKRVAAEASSVASAIAEGIEKDRRRVVIPAIGHALAAASRLVPDLIDARLRATMESAGPQ